MKCPFCATMETQVKDSRPSDDNSSIRRRRYCNDCGARFTTFERLHLREFSVLKRSGGKKPFDRKKLLNSIHIATRKRSVSDEEIDSMVARITSKLEKMGESEIPSETIGEMVMDELKKADEVAYIRFASVYRDFKEAKDFEEFMNNKG